MARRSQTVARLREYALFAFDTFFLRRTRPYLFILVINDKCNLNCFYCDSKNSGRYDLDQDSVTETLNEAYRRGHRALVITGGEPTIWKSGSAVLADVVSRAREIGFADIAVFTNGTRPLVTKEATFIVTIDGTRDTHNSIRAGTYDTVLDNVRNARTKVIPSAFARSEDVNTDYGTRLRPRPDTSLCMDCASADLGTIEANRWDLNTAAMQPEASRERIHRMCS